MSSATLRAAIADLQASAESENEDDVVAAMARLQSTLSTLDSTEVLVAREGQPYLEALQALKWTLDDLASVCERRRDRAEAALTSMHKANSGVGNYQALTHYR